MKQTLDYVMKKHLVSPARLARESGLSEKTVRNIRTGVTKPQIDTMRVVLQAVNKLLKESGQEPVGRDIFNNNRKAR